MQITHTIPPEDFDRLVAYICGELSDPEATEVQHQLSKRSEWREVVAYFEAARVAFRESDVGVTSEIIDVESVVTDVVSLIETEAERSREGRHAQTRTSRSNGVRNEMFRNTHNILRYAAAGGALILMITAVWLTGSFSLQPSAVRNSVASSKASIYSTGNGQRSTIKLPDGTVVFLNVASRLEVPADYDRGNRILKLKGEAFFKVEHQTDNPFTVVAGPSTTQVLGTRFIVRHYAGDTAATIAVEDGKVSVQSIVVTAMQQIQVDTFGDAKVTSARAAQFTFPSGLLILDGQTLAEAIPHLNRWYDADIRLGSSMIVDWQIVGGFKQGSLSDLASLLELTLGVTVVREGKVLTLYPRN